MSGEVQTELEAGVIDLSQKS